MPTKHRVFITASASVSCAGKDNQTLFDNICKSQSGINTDENYFPSAKPAIGKLSSPHTFDEALLLQCREILKQSTLENFQKTLLVVGSSVGGMQATEKHYFERGDYKGIDPEYHPINAIAKVLTTAFEFQDDISFSTACTSSANAIGYAYEVLSKGLYERVLVVGADSLSHTTIGGFLTLGVLSSSPCKPFDASRDGMNVAEAIASVLLERKSTKDAVEVCGVGYSSDAYHMTHPHPEGKGASAAMSQALHCAGLSAEEIDYINAHGTGTKANDSAEAQAIARLFPHAPYVSSTKSITGHTLGAAGALEAIVACKSIRSQTVPPNTFLEKAENQTLHLPTVHLESKVNYVLSNSFAFGGNNCALIFGKVQ